MRECMSCMRCARCMGTAKPSGEENCPYMETLEGYEERFPEALPLETILYERYLVGRALSLTDYSVIYLCWDALLERRVVLREYFPAFCSRREGDKRKVSPKEGAAAEVFEKGKNVFIKEAKLLSLHQDIDEIIHIYRVFEENGTAYYLMEYLEGVTLQDDLEEMGRLSAVTARTLFLQVAHVVERLHAEDICHLNLAPNNIYLDRDRHIKLLDFGNCKLSLMVRDRKNCPMLLEEDYAAPELLLRERPSTRADLYSLGGIYLRMLSGKEGRANVKKCIRDLKKEGVDSTGVHILEMLLVSRPERRPDSLEQLFHYTGGDPKRRNT